MRAHHGATRLGRLARWQRRFSYWVLGACGISGLIWFVLLDGYRMAPPELTACWIAHGVAGFVAMIVIGSALPQHVVVTWRGRRNRTAGAITLGVLLFEGLSALLLLYGLEEWRTVTHWGHVGVGIAALLAFPWHVVRGRRSVAKPRRAT